MRQNRRRLLCLLGKHRWTKREIDAEPRVVCRECGQVKGGHGPNIDVRGTYGLGPPLIWQAGCGGYLAPRHPVEPVLACPAALFPTPRPMRRILCSITRSTKECGRQIPAIASSDKKRLEFRQFP